MFKSIAHAAGILARTPGTLDRLLRDLPEPWATANQGEETWSAFDVIGHLIHGERTGWIRRAIVLGRTDARITDTVDLRVRAVTEDALAPGRPLRAATRSDPLELRAACRPRWRAARIPPNAARTDCG